jgi:hypothetical protein
MIVKAVSLGSPRNGLPGSGGYVYRGTGIDVLEPPPQRRVTGSRPGPKAKAPRRVLAALRSLGGEAATPEIRRAMEFDGGPPFHPAYVSQVLARLSRRDPPLVTRRGRERDGSSHAARWQLADGAAGDVTAPVRTAERPPVTAPADGYCRKCRYLKTAAGHLTACGGGS